MIARKLYDFKTTNVNIAPRWLKKMFEGVAYYYVTEEVCYGLKPYDSNVGASQEVTYQVGNGLYVSSAIMTITQFLNLREIHSRIDGYIQISIFDF
jgi:hypothetical protein